MVDDAVSSIGTANLDNRSFRLNFEISIVTLDEPFAAQVSAMLEEDFGRSRLLESDERRRHRLWFRLGCRASRLFSPVL